MRLKPIITTLALAVALTLGAVPARRGVRTLTQPDGTTVDVTLVGDEFFHYYMTADSLPLTMGHDGSLCYVSLTPDGNAVTSGVLAHNPSQRSAAEARIAGASDRGVLVKAMIERRNRTANLSPARAAARNAKAAARIKASLTSLPQTGMGKYNDLFPAIGSPRALVVLVEYTDVKFKTPDAHEYFDGLLNTRGFSEYGATGCIAEYFEHCSHGKFTPRFDLYGPVSLPNNRAYYGSKYDSNGVYHGLDNSHHMMRDAVSILDPQVDFAQYDTDGDGKVDNMFIIFAGEGEASSDIEEAVWPHQWDYHFSGEVCPRADGVIFDHYACANEWLDSNEPDGVGTFIHEFSHVMGLPDLYNTENSRADYTPGNWSVLDYGPYNNNSRTPPVYSAYERLALGWIEPEVLTTDPRSCTLGNLADSNHAYIIQSDNVRDFFLIENRRQTGWDTYLPNHGMLVWHIDATPLPFQANEVNNDPTHQYVDLIEANNLRDCFNDEVMAGYSFPGTSGNTMLSFNTTPALMPWTGTDTGIEIDLIAESSDGLISFDVNGGDSGLRAPVAVQPDDISSEGFTARWNAVEGATDYLLTVEALRGGQSVSATCDFGSGDNITMPAGWTSSSSEAYKGSSEGYFGQSAPSLKLGREKNVDERYVMSPEYDSDVTGLTFWYRGAGASKSSMVIKGKVGDNWITIDSKSIDSSSTGDTYVNTELPAGIRAIKIIYVKSSGNLALDDITVTRGGSRYEAVDGINGISTGGATEYAVTFPAGVITMRYTVRATDGNEVSRASSPVIVSTTSGCIAAVTDDSGLLIDGRTVTAATGIGIVVRDLAGRTVTAGQSPLTIPAPGMYIITAGQTTVKAAVK